MNFHFIYTTRRVAFYVEAQTDISCVKGVTATVVDVFVVVVFVIVYLICVLKYKHNMSKLMV